jgi:hypothetical protein
MASEPPRPQGALHRGPAAGAAITGALVLGAAVVWGALEIAALLAFEAATTAGAAYAVVRVRHWRRRSAS